MKYEFPICKGLTCVYEIEVVKWEDMSEQDKKYCLNMTYSHGAMRSYVITNSPTCFLARAIKGDVLYGWGCLCDKGVHMLYVKPMLRRNGIGTNITNLAANMADSRGIEVTVYSGVSESLYYFKGFRRLSIGDIFDITDYINMSKKMDIEKIEMIK